MFGDRKHQFYVQFLGWVEANGMRGSHNTDPVIHDLRKKAKKWKHAPKLTLQVSKKEMKITQDIQDEKKKGKKIKTIKFPIIPSRDITYAIQAMNPIDGSPDDIVACIYLGYVPRTKRYVHVHVYRFDSPATASTYTRLINHIISQYQERTAEIERQLVQQGHIADPRNVSVIPVETIVHHSRFDNSDGISDRAIYDDSAADSNSFSDEGYPMGSDDIEPDLQSLKESVAFDSVTDELKARLRMTETKGAAPLLLPPKDYDTIVRRHGDVGKANNRKCLQLPIVGDRNRNTSDESGVGIDVPSPTSSDGRQNSMDISDEKISSSIHSSNDPSPPTSPRNYNGYPPKSARSPMTPRSSNGYGFPSRSRPNSRSSGHFSEGSSTVMYSPTGNKTFENHITSIPPADYENDAPIMRERPVMYSNRDLTKSMPASVLQQELDYGYAVMPQRINRQSARVSAVGQSPRVDMDYGRSAGVRRANSMYR